MKKIQQLLIKWLGKLLLFSFDSLVYLFVSKESVFDKNTHQIVKLLQDNHHDILNEIQQLYHTKDLKNVDDFYKVDTYIGQDENWKVYPFALFNNFFEDNLNKCPNTRRLIESLPFCTSSMFSILHPKMHILPHKGLYKGVVRILFTIESPEHQKAWIKVDGKKIYFESGQSIFFDETFLHEVRNESESQIRSVLYMDIYRRLPFPFNIFNKIIFKLLQKSFFVKTKVSDYKILTGSKVFKKDKLVSYPF